MSNRKELRLTMPCGFAADTGAQLTFTEVKSRHADAIPVDKLSEDQKRKLTIDCWNHGCWDDIVIGDRHITQSEAIDAVNEGSELGNKLVQLAMTGYAHIYRGFFPHDQDKYPLVKMIGKSEPPLRAVSESETPSVTVYNHLSVTVYIYKLNGNQATYFGHIPAEARPVSTTPDFTGQWWVAHTSMDRGSNILGSYAAYPGCTTWDITSFPTDLFLPSTWNSTKSWNVRITNNLKTYVCIWFVMPNGSLKFIDIWNSCSSNDVGPCYIGGSFVATQGNTVISKYFIDSTECTTWSLDIDTPPGGEEIYATGDNNYIFYQVHTPQDDTVTLAAKNFSKQITISSEVTYVYAGLFDCCDAYFAAPGDVTVTIDSQDASSGAITHYNSNTNTDNLYIQMTATGQSLYKLCIKNPPAGVWTITIQAMTNTPVCFQFQTVPTADPYSTMKASLSLCSVLGSNWEDVAYAGFTNIANTQTFVAEEDLNALPVIIAIGALGVALLAAQIATVHNVCKDVQNDQAVAEEATDTIRNAAVPTPSNLHSILLVDANGADDGTKLLFKGRNKYIYPDIETGEFRENYSKLVGENEAIKETFVSKLNDSNLKLVSVAGHGNNDRVCGYTTSGYSPFTPILKTTDVTKELATGKIFHFLACNTANNLGPALVTNEAIAFIGYTKPFAFSPSLLWMFRPDCTIDQELIKGNTVNQAVEKARALYNKMMNNETLAPNIIGMLKNDCDSLVVLGNGNAMLLQANNKDEQQRDTSEDEKQKSTSQGEQQKSTSQDEQHSGEHNHAYNKST